MHNEDEDENFQGKFWYGEVGYTPRLSHWQRQHEGHAPEGLVTFVALGCSIEDITQNLYDALRARHMDMTGDGEYQLGTLDQVAAAIGSTLAARMAGLKAATPVAFGPFPFE